MRNSWIVVLAIIPIIDIVNLIILLRIAFSDQIQYQPIFANNGYSLNIKAR
jgi:hypothetical protein